MLGRSPGEGKGYPFQYSGLEKSMDYPWGLQEPDKTEQLSLSQTVLQCLLVEHVLTIGQSPYHAPFYTLSNLPT